MDSGQRAAVGVEFLPWLEKEAKERQGVRTDITEKIPGSTQPRFGGAFIAEYTL